MANARLEWTPAGGSSQSYTLPVNFTWDYQELAQDETDRERDWFPFKKAIRRTNRNGLKRLLERLPQVVG